MKHWPAWKIALSLISAALLGLCVWAWLHFFEEKPVAIPHFSEAARQDPLLAAGRLLEKHGRTVQSESSLSSLLRKDLPDGMLLIGRNSGYYLPGQIDALRDWVARGNTLVFSPRAEDVTGDAVRDPLAESFGLVLVDPEMEDASQDESGNADGDSADDVEADDETASGEASQTGAGSAGDETVTDGPAAEAASAESPAGSPDCQSDDQAETGTDTETRACEDDADYVQVQGLSPRPLRLEAAGWPLFHDAAAHPPLLADDSGSQLLVFDHGRGRVVMLADMPFTNPRLRQADHAALLLALAAPLPAGAPVLLVRDPDMPSWLEALWTRFHMALLAALAVLLLWLWRAGRRFGPLLAEPDTARRAQLEHLAASGRWLWRSADGRERLLGALRREVLERLQRRLPQLARLDPAACQQLLASQFQLGTDQIRLALHEPAASLPAAFARQIQLLQHLRLSDAERRHDRNP